MTNQSENVYLSLTAYYALSLTEYHMSPHTHNRCEIMYVTSGSCLVSCEEQEYTLSSNQFIFVRENIPHRLEVATEHPCAILNLEFSVQEKPTQLPFAELLTHCPELSDFWQTEKPCVIADDMRNMGYAMKDLISQLQRNQENSAYLLQLLFYRTMLEFVYCMKHNRKSSGVLYIKKACSYIEQNLLGTLTVPEIAAHVGINKSYLQLLFSRMLHCSVGDYITKKRLEQASFLLINSSLSITDIAFASGYNSRQHFAHTFEKAYRMNPSAYRKLHARTLLPDTKGSRFLLDENGSQLRQNMGGRP